MPEEKSLTDEEMRAWLAYIDLSSMLGDYLDRQLQRDAGMSHTTYHLLARLSFAPQHTLRLSALAEGLRITRSRLSHALTKLETDGWILKTDDPADGRGQLATLTDLGYKALENAAPGHTRAVRPALFDRLSPQQVRQLADIAETIVVGLVGHYPEAPPYPDACPGDAADRPGSLSLASIRAGSVFQSFLPSVPPPSGSARRRRSARQAKVGVQIPGELLASTGHHRRHDPLDRRTRERRQRQLDVEGEVD